jgi:hypothetical protein
VRGAILSCIWKVAGPLRTSGKKCGKRILQPKIAEALRHEGFGVDEEDTRQILRFGMPVWRDKKSGEIVATKTRGRRKIDIVVYDGSRPVAFIETESDLNDLRENGVSNRNGHYDVDSIARSAEGRFFPSYNSIERMAAASFFFFLKQRDGEYPTQISACDELAALVSSDASVHNPANLALILVTGFCRSADRRILQARLTSLDAQLICAGEEPPAPAN